MRRRCYSACDSGAGGSVVAVCLRHTAKVRAIAVRGALYAARGLFWWQLFSLHARHVPVLAAMFFFFTHYVTARQEAFTTYAGEKPNAELFQNARRCLRALVYIGHPRVSEMARVMLRLRRLRARHASALRYARKMHEAQAQDVHQ